MTFEELYKAIVLTKESVLEAIDEYTLYCFYTGVPDLVLAKEYSAPYRQDNRPSFTVYPNTIGDTEFMWKDQATGESGDIFKLVKKLHNLTTTRDAIHYIASDFGLRSSDLRYPKEKVVIYHKKEHSKAKIRVSTIPFTEKGLGYWKQFGIGLNQLEKYCVEQIACFWSYPEQEYPYYCKDITFSYRIGEYYQVYSPYAVRENKFRNDLPEDYFFGYVQLPKEGDSLIIDKSCKDVIFCDSIGLVAVAPKIETTMIPRKKVIELCRRFKKVYLMLDDDPAGREMTEKYMKEYPNLLIPKFLPSKDKTQLVLDVGLEEAKRIIRQTLEG